MTQVSTKGSKLVSIFRMAAIAILATAPVLGTPFLLEGERLYAGQYIVSENGRFKFGLSEEGILELLDTNPDQARINAFPGWDGRVLWQAERQVFSQASGQFHSWGDSFVESWMRKMGCGKNYRHSDRRVRGARYFEITPGQRMVGTKLMTLVDQDGKSLWNLNVETAADREYLLVLEDCGRVIGLNESKIFFCTCPYCHTGAEHGNAWLDCNFLDFYFEDRVLAMPLHPGSSADIRKKRTPYPYPATDEVGDAGLKWENASTVLKQLNLNEMTNYRSIWKNVRWGTYDRFWKRFKNYTGREAPGPSGVTYEDLTRPETVACTSTGASSVGVSMSREERKVPLAQENSGAGGTERTEGKLDLAELYKKVKVSDRPKEFK